MADDGDYDLERYLNVRSAYGASLGPDGTLAFLEETTGVPQVWTLDEPGEWPTQRTFFDERVTHATFSPTRPELAFGMDEGGDERIQLFRLDERGRITNLTRAPGAKHYWGGWSHDGDRFAFAANRRDEGEFDVYVQGRTDDPDAADRVYEGEGMLSVGGWSPGDDRLIVTEVRSTFDGDVSVLDLDSRELTTLTDDREARYRSATWGPEGEAVYVCTDAGRDTLSLVRLDAETGAVEPVAGDPTPGDRPGRHPGDDDWDLDGVAIDHDSGRVVYSRNVDGYTELTVGEFAGPTAIREFSSPDLPRGVAGGVSFGPDAERFALTVTADATNANVFVVDVETGAAEQWTRASTGGIPPETFRTADLVRYDSFDGLSVPAFFTLPADPSPGGTPVVVDIHGGPASQRRPSFSGLKQYFCSRGYAYFEPNVRGSAGYGRAYTQLDDVERRMDSVADLKAGVEWLRDQPAVDPDRIVAKGGSYGGFMVLAALSEYPDLWAAGVDVVGIANFVTFLENTGEWRREHREAEYGSLDEDRELLESISPINSVDRITAPLFVIHGANDPRVPVGEAEQVVEAVRARGVPVEKLVFEDEGHGLTRRENRIEAYTRVVEFLDEHV